MTAALAFTTWALDEFVPGIPKPQGSKRAFNHRTTGQALMVEMSGQALKDWRGDVRAQTREAWRKKSLTPMGGALVLDLQFVMPRPKYMCTKKALALPTPPHTKTPDLDKLLRGVCDALKSAQVVAEDKLFVHQNVTKRYAEFGEESGCRIRVGWAE